MNTTEFESPITSSEAQETANASSSYSVGSINCQTTNSPITSDGNIENDSPPNSQTSSSSTNQGMLKVFAPVITHDVTLPNTARKVPMVMVPVPDSRTLMAIPVSTLSQLKDSPIDTMKEEQQARDLLVWDNGVGTLDGCDLRFRINQLGCLELLDSDDEVEFDVDIIPTKQMLLGLEESKASNQRNNSINTNKTSNGVSGTISTQDRLQKRAKLDIDPAPIKQISPGSSLLRDGPNTRRPKSSSGSNLNSSGRIQANSLSLLKKVEHNQNTILLDKLVSKQRIEEMKTHVEEWTTEEVRKFVDSIPGCSGYGELFESQQICGKSLLYIDQRDMLDVINVKLGPAVKIYHAISLLK